MSSEEGARKQRRLEKRRVPPTRLVVSRNGRDDQTEPERVNKQCLSHSHNKPKSPPRECQQRTQQLMKQSENDEGEGRKVRENDVAKCKPGRGRVGTTTLPCKCVSMFAFVCLGNDIFKNKCK